MKRLGRYEILRPLGRGGMGTVYEAVLLGPGGLRKPVALKVLHQGQDALQREARIGGLLRHRHLVDVYEVAQEDGQWFCALELCRGGSLAQHLPLPPRAVVEVGLQVCEALDYAHRELGLVHLDLKPDNLLLDGAAVKVADLGIAHAHGFGGSNAIRGTPAYMAPEQTRAGPVDARTDLFALGITLVELATGSRPQLSQTLDLTSFDAPVEVDGIPAWLAPAVERCVATEPDDRWPDMASLARALGRLEVRGPGLRELLGVHDEAASRSDAFVGRSAELDQLQERMGDPGLVLVKGPAGIGKSRLAMAAARRWEATTGAPVWWCDTSTATTATGLIYAVASALDVRLPPGDVDAHGLRLGLALAARGPGLLVLDGFEQLGESAPVLRAWAERADQARILVTSRTTLPIDVDDTIDVGPLPMQDATALLAARALQRGAEVSGDPALAELATRLDGVPLALELAAGRLGVLTLADVLERLDLSLLRQATDGRHGTLRAALDWSWDLLTPVEQQALAQLSVFSGGFTLEAAEGVLDLGGASPRDAVAALVDHSMVSDAGESRLRLLTGIREHAAERLGDAGAVQARHGAWFARLSGQGPDVLVPEVDNLVSACRAAVARGDGELAAQLLQGAWTVLRLRGPFDAALALAEQVLPVVRTPSGHALAGLSRGEVLVRSGRNEDALPQLRASQALYHELGDPDGEARAVLLCGDVHRSQKRVEEALACYQHGLALWRELGDRRREGQVLASLGSLEPSLDYRPHARSLLEEALRISREQGDRSTEATALGTLGNLCWREGRHAEAEGHFLACLRLQRELGDRRGEALTLGNLALVVRRLDRLGEALDLSERAARITRELGDRHSEAGSLRNLAAAHLAVGEIDQARDYWARSRALYQALGSTHGDASAAANLGFLSLMQDRLDEARTLIEEALALFRLAPNPTLEGIAHGNLAEVLHDLGHRDEAHANYRLALERHRQTRNRVHEAVDLVRLARLVSDESQAAGLLEEAEALLEDRPDASTAAMAHAVRAERLAATGHPDASTSLARAEAVAPHREPEAARAIRRARRALGLTG